MKFPYPKWIETMPEGEAKVRAQNRFVLRLCCLYAHPHGHIHDFASLIGVHPRTLQTQIQSERMVATEFVKKAIRDKLGPEFVPPDLHV